ncbi:MAG: enoyl-CoA hydratase-related protein [Rhodovibrionaceae bacterium]
MADPVVLYEVEGAIGRITLNRPEGLNGLNRALLGTLLETLETAEQDEGVRALILTGSGRAFSAGQDLAEAGVIDAPEGERPAILGESLERFYHPVILKLRETPLPVVAAVNGIAAGAGMSLALACDLIVAAESASFLQAFRRIGLQPDCGSSYFLPRLIGEARARELALLGEALPASQARDWGLINRCVPDARLIAEAEALAGKLAGGPRRAQAHAKRALAVSQEASLPEQLNLEARLQVDCAADPDFAEGLAAFKEKRPARFH